MQLGYMIMKCWNPTYYIVKLIKEPDLCCAATTTCRMYCICCGGENEQDTV